MLSFHFSGIWCYVMEFLVFYGLGQHSDLLFGV